MDFDHTAGVRCHEHGSGDLPIVTSFFECCFEGRHRQILYANDHQRYFEIPDRTGPVNQVRSLWGTHEPLYQFCQCRRNWKFNSEVDKSNKDWCLATLRGSHSTEVCDDLDFLSVVSTRTLHLSAPPLSCESLAEGRKRMDVSH